MSQVVMRTRLVGWLTALPQAPCGADDVAFEGAYSLTPRLAFGASPSNVGLGSWSRAELRDGDAINECVQLAVAAAG